MFRARFYSIALVAIIFSLGAPSAAFSDDPTPAQQEGPYYPVRRPADSDWDLTVVDDGSRAAGRILELSGSVATLDGRSLVGAVVEIWQTDDRGIYLHPRDPQVKGRDTRFQGYGEAVTDSQGKYRLRTIVPGLYGSRPAHIHFKVRQGPDYLLTSQFYFSNHPDESGRRSQMLGALTLPLTRNPDGTYSARGIVAVR